MFEAQVSKSKNFMAWDSIKQKHGVVAPIYAYHALHQMSSTF